ncbi:exonuclease family protein [Tritrichomonas foetus]|uniref:Exonuclease family protein n=1 Tax=Tritrichomonas foetus TaxID=1144522 RepID=A0A1J4KRN4_9EUKA|nr:exonuclease family protein [Tritrichomonas foetus]|eukprot:OHT13953.1 exonuclease family protein [Tritrichomonas foetus]
MSISYFDIFPDAKLEIKPKPKEELTEELDPNHIGDLIKYLFSQKPPCPWITIDHPALCKRVYVLVFDGLDNSRWNKYRNELSNFSKISEGGYPMVVLAKLKNFLIVPATQTLLGYSLRNRKRYQYKNYEEMLVSLNKQYDNGYPIKPGTELPTFKRPCRYAYFKMEPLTEEQLQSFKELPDTVEHSLDVLAIDCEMISTTVGEEVARLSGVNQEGEMVIDEYFKPLGDVLDYRTHVSGITEEKVKDRELTSEQCLDVLQKIADKHTILIGHSLENDVRVLKLIHERVIDTALLYNMDAKYPNKPPLAKIYAKYIKKDFRTEKNTEGHDSVEDARACLELAKYAMEKPVSEVEGEPELPQLFKTMLENVCKINVFGPDFHINFAGIDDKVECFVKGTIEDVSNSFLESFSNEQPPLTYAYFHQLSRCNLTDEDETEACKQYNLILEQTLEKVPPQSAILIYTANGNLKRLRSSNGGRPGADESRTTEFTQCRQGLLWVVCKNAETV